MIPIPNFTTILNCMSCLPKAVKVKRNLKGLNKPLNPSFNQKKIRITMKMKVVITL